MSEQVIERDSIPKSYAPSEIEAGIIAKWDEANIGHADTSNEASQFSILIPPPNVTAPLHIGHALNSTLQDVLIRWHRMRGFNTLWMPGTDHAGIATQTVVEKRLMQQENKKRTDFERDEFIGRVQEWKDEYEATILRQFKSLGASCDWDRTRFTMDPVCTAAVREAFFKMFKDDLIYRGKRLVNWDPVTLTALADDEVEMKEVAGHMYYLRYPLEDGSGHVTVATTRPETMLGDTAVAVNPEDPRAEGLRGKSIRLPIVGRVIPIVEDDYVVMPGDGDDPKAAFATGFLKVTPAHDPNDWDIGLRHELEVINVMASDGSISSDYGWDDCSTEAEQFLGMSREDARVAIIDWFKAKELLEDIKSYDHSVGHSYRSHVPIEPYLSDQWYVRVTDDKLGGEALRALAEHQYEGAPPKRESGQLAGDGELRFTPARYAKTFQSWHENLRDWCISRQLWWGHQIPIWTKEVAIDSDIAFPHQNEESTAFATERDDAAGTVTIYVCVRGGHQKVEQALIEDGFVRDEDVLDTWFSSALWPLSTMGWPTPENYPDTVGLLEKFNPSSMLVTGRDIITLWVSRMTMLNRYFQNGTLPFTNVFINPMIQDGFGQRMSKSLGNGVDPRDIISTHGADAMRYALTQLSTGTQDVRLTIDLICPHSGRTFEPEYVKSQTGHEVMAPIQTCPSDETKKISTLYGLLIGASEDTEETPLAVNTSSRFDVGRNFANKFWNSARFAMLNISSPSARVSASELLPVDVWMLSRIVNATRKLDESLNAYHFNVAAETLYDLLWRDFCDWYLEAIKPTIKENECQQRTLLTVLNVICRLLHPVCPFVTEAMWSHLCEIDLGSVEGLDLEECDVLALASWPVIENIELDAEVIASFQAVQVLVTAIRGARASSGVKPKRRIDITLSGELYDLASKHNVTVCALAGVDKITEGTDVKDGMPIQIEGQTVYLSNMFDAEEAHAQMAKLDEEIASLEKKIRGMKNRLSNESYVNNAPEHIVQESRDLLEQAEEELKSALEARAS